MKNRIFLIPGFGETCKLVRYQYLIHKLEKKGYHVVPVNPDWYKPLTSHVFRIHKSDIVIGFSFGAVISYLIAKKFTCKKIILASLSPLHTFGFKSLQKDCVRNVTRKVGKRSAVILGTKLAKNIMSIKISLNSLRVPYITLSGQLERGMPANIKVPKTAHYMTRTYANTIAGLLGE